MKKNIGLSLLTGILFALALPPFKTGFLAYWALIPFFLLLEEKHGREAFRWGYITGLFISVPTLFWLGWVTIPGLFGVLLVWPLYIALFALLHTFLVRQLSSAAFALAPFIWVSIEYLQSLTELAFPWNYIGYSQSYYLPLIQYAEYTAVFGVSFWVVLLNVLFYITWKRYSLQRTVSLSAIIAIVALIAGPLFFGLNKMASGAAPGEKIKISLIQGNRDPNAKWDGDVYADNYDVYEKLTKQSLAENPDLVIWPETALPFYLRSKPQYIQSIHSLIDSTATSLLTGTMDFVYFRDGSYDAFNSAMLFEPDNGRIQTYSKRKLVPFSERVPYKKYFPFNFLKKALWDLGIGDFGIGEDFDIFSAKIKSHDQNRTDAENLDYKTGTAICYESVFPDHVRKYVNAGANFLIIITNDAWFGKTSAPFQHTQIAVFRAIENRRAIARCANTGISCFIDRFGRVRKSTPLFTEAIVTDNLLLNNDVTFYTHYGNLFVIFIAVASALFVLSAFIKKIVGK